jgi:hypothetical protein
MRLSRTLDLPFLSFSHGNDVQSEAAATTAAASKSKATSSLADTTVSTVEIPLKKKKKHMKSHLSNEQRLLTDMSDERLQNYGLNPTRFKNFVRFNKDKLAK